MQPFIQSTAHPILDTASKFGVDSPAESRLHDHANQFHLFCYPMGTKVKFGWNFRDVNYEHQEGGHNKLGQRGLNK